MAKAEDSLKDLDWLMDKDYKFKNITIYKNH